MPGLTRQAPQYRTVSRARRLAYPAKATAAPPVLQDAPQAEHDSRAASPSGRVDQQDTVELHTPSFNWLKQWCAWAWRGVSEGCAAGKPQVAVPTIAREMSFRALT